MAALCACSNPSEKAVQTAIAQTESAELEIPDSVIQTAIAKTQTAEEPLATAELNLEGTPSNDINQDCEITTPYHEDWPLAFCDTFSDNRNGWGLGSGSDDISRSIYAIDDGKLIVDLTGKATSGYLSGVIQWLPVVSAEDFVITVKGDVFSDYKSCTWGIVFNEKDWNNFLAFMISSRDGMYYLTKYEDGEQKFPISGKTNSAIIWDEQNELTIVAENGFYQFFINGEFVDDYETDDIVGTNIALATWTGEGVTARFEFDDLLIKALISMGNLTSYLIP
jgi:hypothetical protein